MEQLESQLGAVEVTLSNDILDRIDKIVPPGVTLNREDSGYIPPAAAGAVPAPPPYGLRSGWVSRRWHDVHGHALRRADAMEEPRKLYRSRNQRMVAGVCGGLADYFNIDATVVRVLFLILSVFGGTGLVIYLVMWIIVPDASKA